MILAPVPVKVTVPVAAKKAVVVVPKRNWLALSLPLANVKLPLPQIVLEAVLRYPKLMVLVPIKVTLVLAVIVAPLPIIRFPLLLLLLAPTQPSVKVLIGLTSVVVALTVTTPATVEVAISTVSVVVAPG